MTKTKDVLRSASPASPPSNRIYVHMHMYPDICTHFYIFWDGETTACTLAQAQPVLLRCNPWQTALQPGEPSAQPPMSQSAQCGPDSGAAQPASAPGGAAHVSTNSAEQPGSRDSADGSVEQPFPSSTFRDFGRPLAMGRAAS